MESGVMVIITNAHLVIIVVNNFLSPSNSCCMKFVLLGFLVLLLYSCNPGKEIQVQLKTAKENDGLLGSTQTYLKKQLNSNDDSNDFSNRNELDTFLTFSYPHTPEEYYYHEFVKGELDTMLFTKEMEYYDIDTSRLRYKKYDSESLFLMGKKRNGDCVIVADENNNNRFSDDSIHVLKNWFNSKDKIQSNKLPRVTIKNLVSNYSNNKVTFSQEISLRPFKKDSTIIINGSFSEEMGLYLISSDYLIGRFKAYGVNYKMAVRNLSAKYLFDKNNTIIAIGRKRQPFVFQVSHDVSSLHRVGETVNLKKGAIEIKKIKTNGDAIFLKVVPKDISKEVMKDISVKDFVTKDSFYLNSLGQENDYLIIDFWGSWCQPCITAFPKLKELETSLKNKGIAFLGIIYDDSTNSIKIKSLIEKFSLTWNQVLIDKNTPNSLIESNRIISFPTFLLVDKKLNIIYRDFGIDGLERMKQKLIDLRII